jgi:hypothetical protein
MVSTDTKLIPFTFICIEEHIMKTMVIKDLAVAHGSACKASSAVRSLSREEMKQVQGGRLISVLVDGRPGGVIDDFQLDMAIFKGDIGVRVV